MFFASPRRVFVFVCVCERERERERDRAFENTLECGAVKCKSRKKRERIPCP